MLGAYQYLLDWHRDWYVAQLRDSGLGTRDPSPGPRTPDPDFRARLYQGRGGQWRLTIQEKKRILLNHIYGVDIDPQAVEVTKLSLLLKVLEGETSETLGSTLRLFHERALPDLDRNIKCGNSLIGPDFYEGQQLDLFDEEERLRINVFDWRAEFPEVFAAPSVPTPSRRSNAAVVPSRPSDGAVNDPTRLSDAAVPPARPAHARPAHDWAGSDQRRDRNALGSDRSDRDSPSIPDAGFDAVIGNPPYLYSAGQQYSDYYRRRFQLAQYQTDFYVYFVERGLFLTRRGGRLSMIVSDAWLNSQYFSVMREHLLSRHAIDRVAVFDYPAFEGVTLENSVFTLCAWKAPGRFQIDRFDSPGSWRTENDIDPGEAIKRGLIDPRQSGASERTLAKIERNSPKLGSMVRVNRGLHAYRTDGYGQSRYGPGPQTRRDKSERSYHACHPLDETYLPEVRGKDVYRFYYVHSGSYISYGPWLAEPRDPIFFRSRKIVLRKILGTRLHGTYIEEPTAVDQSLYILIHDAHDESVLLHCLGVLLSRLGAWYLRTKYSIYDTLYPWYTKKQLSDFPTKSVDDRLVRFVRLALDLQRSLAGAQTAHERTALQRQIDATDRQIDQLVYELYGITDEETRIIEEATAK